MAFDLGNPNRFLIFIQLHLYGQNRLGVGFSVRVDVNIAVFYTPSVTHTGTTHAMPLHPSLVTQIFGGKQSHIITLGLVHGRGSPDHLLGGRVSFYFFLAFGNGFYFIGQRRANNGEPKKLRKRIHDLNFRGIRYSRVNQPLCTAPMQRNTNIPQCIFKSMGVGG